MTRKIVLQLLITISTIPLVFSQNDTFDYGHMDGDKYVNSYFGLELTLPENWSTRTQQQMNKLTESGRELIAGDDENMKATFKVAEINVANLLAASQYEQGSAVEYNPSIMVVAENIKTSPGIKSDYLFLTRRLLMQAQFKYDSIDSDFEKEIINDIEFYKMKAAVNYVGLNIQQTYYTTIVDRFCIAVIISYVNNEEKQVLLNTINSTTIKK